MWLEVLKLKREDEKEKTSGSCMDVPGKILDREGAPEHLFNIPQLDFSDDVFVERLTAPWFRLGAWTEKSSKQNGDVVEVIERFSFLLPTDKFDAIFDRLESVGNVSRNMGKPTAWTSERHGTKSYWYAPFHQFEVNSIIVEPLVFIRGTKSSAELFINPDLWMFFELEEVSTGSGIWWDPPKGQEVIRKHSVNGLNIVEIRADYLRKYLQARQLSLVVGHYHHLHFHRPSDAAVNSFVKEDVTLGSIDQRAKAVFQNWGLRNDCVSDPFLQRRLHLWYQLVPEPIDLDDPWAEVPPFDAFEFTFPTSSGPVAPARWASFRGDKKVRFSGVTCDFMDSVYFRQDVLSKYEGAAGYNIGDDGSVTCYNDWGLVRSTSRIGNELLSTGIGDFAEGVPFEEWPHWKQYVVDPPSSESFHVLASEKSIQNSVNDLVSALTELNSSFLELSRCFGVHEAKLLWTGSLDSLAGRQLKWVYPVAADDDEFLKRATLLSTFVLEELGAKALRRLLGRMDSRLEMNDEEPPKPLGSRKLLQRLVLSAILIEEMNPSMEALCSLVLNAEGKSSESDKELQLELQRLNKRSREDMAALAFLYDLRNAGGLAHSLNKQNASNVAVKLNLPGSGWSRKDYLKMLGLVTSNVQEVAGHLERASMMQLSKV